MGNPATIDVFGEMSQTVEQTRLSSFQNKKRKHYRKSINGSKKSSTIDEFGNPYRAVDTEDKTEIISVTLPKSLIRILDDKRQGIARSRYLRTMIEFCLNVENTDSITKGF